MTNNIKLIKVDSKKDPFESIELEGFFMDEPVIGHSIVLFYSNEDKLVCRLITTPITSIQQWKNNSLLIETKCSSYIVEQ